MRNKIAIILVITGLFVACAAKAPMPVVFQIPTRHVDYMKEVKPLLDNRCAVCHSCYNSPCQLKLDSFEGADRGATKKAVYNGSRLRSMDPTRLFTDAQSTGEWRQERIFQRDRQQSVRRVERFHHDRDTFPQDEKPEKRRRVSARKPTI